MEEQMQIDEKEHAVDVLRQLNKFRKEKHHCNFVIKAGSEDLHVHRNVLAASSDYFKAMLSYDTKENQSGVVKIKDSDPECIKKCVDFMYTGAAFVAKEKREQMMYVAHLMQLRRLCDGVSLSLEKSLDSNSFFYTKKIANTFSLKKLESTCENFALEHFRSISLEKEFKHLEKEYVAFLIKSKNTKGSDAAKCKALIIWAGADLEERSKFFEEMLEHLNLLKIPLGYRRYLIEKEPLVFLSNSCLKALLISVMDKANVLAKDFTIGDDGIRNAITVFDKSSKAVQAFEPDQRRWTRMQNIPDEVNGKVFCAVLMGDQVYTLMNDKTGHRLNYNDATATWVRIPDRTVTTTVLAVVLDGSLYAFDNANHNSKAVERLDPSDGTWTHVTDRENSCYLSAVVAAQGALYSAGGYAPSNRYARDFVSFDPIAAAWSTLPQLPTGREGAATVELNGKIYVMGGCTGAHVRTVESFDFETETWTTVSNTNHPHYLFSACVLGEKIYVVGGQGSNNTIEVFDPYENTWNVVETMTGKDIHPGATVGVHVFT